MSRSLHLVMPEARAMIHQIGTALNADGVAGLRTAMTQLIASLPPPARDGVTVQQHRIGQQGSTHGVRVLVYTPASAATRLPVHLDIHGGGYIAGSVEIDQVICRGICAAAQCVVVSVDYRLAPEAQYPAALDDCYAALEWIHREGHAFNMDTSRLTIGGESAGGGLTASLALRARERGGPKILLQLLGQPMLDDRTGSTADAHPYAGEFVWTPELNRLAWRSYLGVEPGSASVPSGAIPARIEDLSGLPPTFIVVGSLDLFVDEASAYAQRLMRSGVPTELHVLPGAFHGSASLIPQAVTSVAYFQLQYGALREAYRAS